MEKIEAETKAFEDQGEPPKSVSTKGYESDLRKAKIKLEAAYATAVKEFTQAGKRAEGRQPCNDSKGSSGDKSSMHRHQLMMGLAPARALVGKELLTNPGGKEPLVDGRIPGWEPVQGVAHSIIPARTCRRRILLLLHRANADGRT